MKSFNFGSTVGWLFLMVILVGVSLLAALPIHAHAAGSLVSSGWGHIAMAGIIPSLAQVKSFSTTGGGLEGLRQSLYDEVEERLDLIGVQHHRLVEGIQQ